MNANASIKKKRRNKGKRIITDHKISRAEGALDLGV